MTKAEFEDRANELLALLGVGPVESAAIVTGEVGVSVSLETVTQESAAIVVELNKLRVRRALTRIEEETRRLWTQASPQDFIRMYETERPCIGRLTYLKGNK